MFLEESQQSPPRSRCMGSEGRSGVLLRGALGERPGGYSTRRRLHARRGHAVPRGDDRPPGEEPGCRTVNRSGGNRLSGGSGGDLGKDSSRLRVGVRGCTQERRQKVGTREASGIRRPRIRVMNGTVVPRLPGRPGSLWGAGSEAAGTEEGFSLPVSQGARSTPGRRHWLGSTRRWREGLCPPPTEVVP